MRGRAAATLLIGLALQGCARGDPWAQVVARTPGATLLERIEPRPGHVVILYAAEEGGCGRVVLAQARGGGRVVEEEVVGACDAAIQAGITVHEDDARRPTLVIFSAVATERCEAPSDPAPGVHDFGACELGVSHAVERWRYAPGRRRWTRAR